jgi:hypothetical protein
LGGEVFFLSMNGINDLKKGPEEALSFIPPHEDKQEGYCL